MAINWMCDDLRPFFSACPPASGPSEISCCFSESINQSSLTKPPTHLRSSPFQPLTPFILFNFSLPK